MEGEAPGPSRVGSDCTALCYDGRNGGRIDWAKGYVADIGYTAGFVRQTTRSHMAFAALTIGRAPGRALKPQRVLELGFGQGFGLALLAAANPDVAFEGYDFNPIMSRMCAG